MRLYVLVTSHAYDYPEVNVPRTFTDRVKAIDAWRHDVLEAEGYPDEDVDTEVLVEVGKSADEFLIDVEKTEVGWIVNSNHSLEEMCHVQLFAVDEETP